MLGINHSCQLYLNGKHSHTFGTDSKGVAGAETALVLLDIFC